GDVKALGQAVSAEVNDTATAAEEKAKGDVKALGQAVSAQINNAVTAAEEKAKGDVKALGQTVSAQISAAGAALNVIPGRLDKLENALRTPKSYYIQCNLAGHTSSCSAACKEDDE